ncbi:unnamed protein product [Tuber aestivum]|uniref:Uncharacterized protein n=1 Tax=Tuber aestivum TaxID=59557 RepID=A0A292PXK5_9PEZI|nr:unnamed protein product [Tuber aestivum]
MPTISRIPVRTLLSQFSKRGDGENKGEDNNGGKSPVVIVGLVVAVLTLLVGIVSLRSSRFHRLVSCLLPLSIIKKILGPALLDPAPTVSTAREDSSANPLPETSVPTRVFIYNNYSNATIIGTNSGTISYGNSGIAGEASRAPQAAGRHRPTVAERFPWR